MSQSPVTQEKNKYYYLLCGCVVRVAVVVLISIFVWKKRLLARYILN